MKGDFPRLLLSGTNSGCGKTTIFCALLQALKDRGENVAAFKCGPDYIDPMFHRAVIGAESGNLDSYFCGEYLSAVFADSARDLNLIEGAMGYYDGLGFTDEHSAYDVGRRLHAPAVLVADGRGSSLSIAAQMQGFLRFRKDSNVRGFILNRVSRGVYEGIKKIWNEECGAKLYGYFPVLPEELAFKSRHLGLVTAAEVENLREMQMKLAKIARDSVDIEGLTALAASAPALEYDPPALPRFPKIHIAVAKDAAFCFYYSENFGLFEKMGAELSFFSPLEDAAPPAEADCLYFGGGYPELYAEKLSANASMLESVRAAHARGVPIFAECGGFLYLNRLLDGYAMAGVLHGESVNKHKPVRFGYVELEANEDCLIAKKGARLRGHEFHYYDCTENGEAFTARRKGSEYRCTAAGKTIAAGFAHVHFYSNLECAATFYENCLEAKKCRK